MSKSKKYKKNVSTGIAHINSSFNNTIITITDTEGNKIAGSTAGSMGFKGTRKSTPYAAQIAAAEAAKKAQENGMKTLEVRSKGPGIGKEAAIRELANFFIVTAIKEITGFPHGGCRPPKRRRV